MAETPRAPTARAPAKTLAGLIFKARYAASHYPEEYDEEVMASIVDDPCDGGGGARGCL